MAEPFERWRTRVARGQFEPALWLLAVRGDELVGAVLAFAYPSGGWGETLAVRPGPRRLGIGMALLRAAFAAFRRRGATAVALSVDAENPTGATRLYERAGMRVVYRVDRYEKSVGTL